MFPSASFADNRVFLLELAVHRLNQKKLPILVVGADLPLLVRLTGEAKTYAERLFEYPNIGTLNESEARRALVEPLSKMDVRIDEDAVNLVTDETHGYPYFIQEWGYQIWNTAKKSPIKRADVVKSSRTVIIRLDQNFFRSRYERLSDPQKIYLRAMAELGLGPYRSGDIAKLIGKSTTQLGTTREGLIKNGMIYSPKYGFTAFTVPLFDDFMKRIHPKFKTKS